MALVDLTLEVKKSYPETEIILLTAQGNIHDGVQAIKNGAFDYIIKGRFSVTDTGMGIEEKYLLKIFDRFYRIHGGLSTGTGLGLTISKEFC